MTNKSELSLMWQMKREAERDFHKFIKYVAELEKENEELKNDLKEVAKELIQHHEEYKNMADMVVELEKENKELKNKLDKLRTDNIYEEWLYE